MESKIFFISKGNSIASAMQGSRNIHFILEKMEEKENMYPNPIMKTEEEVEEMTNARINKDLNVERLNHMIYHIFF